MSNYVTTKSCGEPVGEHRIIMERSMGRRLQWIEHVHHVNGDTRDNRIENLEVLDSGDHVSLHHQKYPKTKKCAVCGCVFTPHKTKRKRAKTCGPECRAILIGVHRRRVTPEKVKEILWMRNKGCTFKEIGESLGITATRACQILKGRHIKTLK